MEAQGAGLRDPGRARAVAGLHKRQEDHLDRGSSVAYRAVKRSLAELVDPDGALVLNAEDPVVARLRRAGDGPRGPLPRDRPMPGGLGIVDDWIVAAGVVTLPLAGGGTAATGPGGGSCRSPSSRSPASTTSPTRSPPSPSGCCSASPRTGSAARWPGSRGVEHRLQMVGLIDGVRFVNDSQGTQPDAVIAGLRAFPAPVVLIAGGRDKGIDLAALARVAAETVDAAVLIGESGPTLEGLLRAPASRARRAPRRSTRRSPPPTRSPTTPWRVAGRHRGDGPAQPGGRLLRHVRGLRRPRPGVHRGRRPPGGGAMSTDADHRGPRRAAAAHPSPRRRSRSSASATSPSTGSSSPSSPWPPSGS